MRVLVIGATGVLGRPAVRRLLAEGHEVAGLARNESRQGRFPHWAPRRSSVTCSTWSR